jgi:hypothetical protein
MAKYLEISEKWWLKFGNDNHKIHQMRRNFCHLCEKHVSKKSADFPIKKYPAV